MKKTAFLFPGQGSQYVGMGKDFYEQYPAAKEMIDLASEVSGMDLTSLLFQENTQIHETKYTQIAMLADEVAILKVLEEKGFTPDVTAGLSLGEYGALVASGAMSPEDAFRIIVKRGLYMQEAVPTGGAMTAIMGLDAEKIETVCKETAGIVSVANYNCPGQIVITGEEHAVAAAADALKNAGAKRCLPLKVSGPFHSEMLKEAGQKLDEALSEISFSDIRIPYLTNVTADYVTDKEMIRDLLVRQISSSVRWQQSVERMIADGVEVFVEIGPKKSLTGFMKKIDKTKETWHIDTVADLEVFLAAQGNTEE